jgi:hypothetical protein
MTVHNGKRVDAGDGVGKDYETLVAELGTAIANKPMHPAKTLGAAGFDMSASNTFVFYKANTDGQGQPTAWERAHIDEDPGAYMFIPEVQARKGLPFSLEGGVNLGWIGNSRTGLFGGYGRVGIIEGYKPAPDVTLQFGYSGYVGNDELDLGVLDIGVSVGSTFPFGTYPGINQAQFSPFLNFTTMRISATPLVDQETIDTIGAKSFGRKDVNAKDAGNRKSPIVLPRIGGGMNITNGAVTFRLVTTWTPQTVPTLGVGMGFSF